MSSSLLQKMYFYCFCSKWNLFAVLSWGAQCPLCQLWKCWLNELCLAESPHWGTNLLGCVSRTSSPIWKWNKGGSLHQHCSTLSAPHKKKQKWHNWLHCPWQYVGSDRSQLKADTRGKSVLTTATAIQLKPAIHLKGAVQFGEENEKKKRKKPNCISNLHNEHSAVVPSC